MYSIYSCPISGILIGEIKEDQSGKWLILPNKIARKIGDEDTIEQATQKEYAEFAATYKATQ